MDKFFHFTAQGIVQITLIGSGVFAFIRYLRKIDRNIAMWLWEHEVMWIHHRKNYRVPIYPSLIVERRQQSEKNFKPSRFNNEEEI